jgi:hypothetical protein
MIVAGLAGLVTLGGCDRVREYLDREAPEPPPVEEVEPYYTEYRGIDSVRIRGNVVEVYVEQPYSQVERGGSLWARVGPYVYLMTPSTRSVFDAYPGVAGVRVITRLPDGDEVARAMLRRDAMSDVQWRRTLNILGTALEGGRENPRKLEELTEWSEERTEFRYNPEYVN